MFSLLTALEQRKIFSPPLLRPVSLFSRALFYETRHTATIPSCPWPPTLQGLPLLEKVTALYIVHVNTFPSPNGRQLLNPGRLTGVQADARAWPLGAFITCLVGCALVYRGTQPPGALTFIPTAQVSSSLSLYATCWEDSCSLRGHTLPLQEERGVKRATPCFHCYLQFHGADCTLFMC